MKNPHPISMPVCVLRPLLGTVELSGAFLETLCRQTLTPAEIRYGVDSERDPAVAVVRRLQAQFPQIPTRLHVGINRAAPNRKIAKLAELSLDCEYPVILAVDQDIKMPARHLEEIVSCFSDSGTGMVTCLYRLQKPETLPSALALLSIHADFFPSVLVGEQVEGGLKFAFGATLAVRRDVLEKIGGFKSVREYLADDYELGSRVCKAGYRIVLSASLVEHAPGPLSFREYWEREIRASRTHRVCRPAGYALSVFAQGLPWAIALVLLSGFSGFPAKLILVWIFARVFAVVTSHFVLTFGEGPWWPLILLPLHEVARFLFWILAFTGNRVKWGKRLYQVSREGRMRKIGED